MKISSKLYNIIKFKELNDVKENLKDYQLVFITAFGLVVGDIINNNFDATVSDSSSEIVEDLALRGVNLLTILPLVKAKHLSEDTSIELIGDGALLPLENVVVYKNNFDEKPVMHRNILYLHSEDIIGFSLVSRLKN